MKVIRKTLHNLRRLPGSQWIYGRLFNLHRRYANLLVRLSSDSVRKQQIPTRPQLLIICVAFNRENLIEVQIQTLRQHLKDQPFEYVVIDNSTERRDAIREVCQRLDAEYYPVPPFIHRMLLTKVFWNGVSHGAALNWAMHNIVEPRQPNCLALLDHDIFPLTSVSLIERLGTKPFFGVSRVLRRGWYVWPGWCIFRWKMLESAKPDFIPVYIKDCFLDSGGGNYKRFYSKYRLDKEFFAEMSIKRITHSKELKSDYEVWHCDCLQLIDKYWVHMVNGSNNAFFPKKDRIVNYFIHHLDEIAEKAKIQT